MVYSMSEEQYAAHEARLVRLEGDMSSMKVAVVRIEKDMQLNNKMTSEIRDNTGEIVTILKASKLFGKFAVWLTGVLAAAAALWTLVKTIR